MVLKGLCSLLYLFSLSMAGLVPEQAKFDRVAFYSVFASSSLKQVNEELKAVTESDDALKEAFEGALLMRKAGLVVIPKDKLKFFKAGEKKLEASIRKDEKNPELRFLRLAIQENAPGILNYHANQQEDASYLRATYKDLPKVVRDAILEYSKNSKVIKPMDF